VICSPSARDILGAMRTCISCGEPITSRRKDTKFCRKAACRAKEYRKRQAEAAQAPRQKHTHHASAVLSCPCGRQFLLQMSLLEGNAQGNAPSLYPVSMPSSESVTRTVQNTELQPATFMTGPSLQSAAGQNSSEQIAQSSAPDATSAAPTPLPNPTVPSLPVTSVPFCTGELYFTDSLGQRLPFWEAVRERSGGASAHPAAGMSSTRAGAHLSLALTQIWPFFTGTMRSAARTSQRPHYCKKPWEPLGGRSFEICATKV
jgi:hypothetical protein